MKNTSNKTNQKSKVLFITYYFPPAGGVGRIRIVKFLKYLAEFNWIPQVLTVKKQFYPLRDESLLKEVPNDILITRINYFEPGLWWANHFWQSFLTYYLYPLIFIPDIRALWVWPAIWRGYNIIKTEKIKVIFTSSSSVSDHLVAYYLKRLTGVRWVADFRDEWATNAYFRFPTPLHRWFARFWERKVVERADKITAVSPLMTEYFQTLSRQTKCLTLMNGFDPADFTEKLSKPRRSFFQIVYAGTLFRHQRLDTLEQALKELNLPKIKIEFFGGKKRLPHQEMVKIMRQADILLFILSVKEHPLFLTGKLFEYLAARRPILALANSNNAAAKIIKKLRAGEVAHPDKVPEIKEAVLKLYRQWEKNKLNVPAADLSDFDRCGTTGKLAQLFHELMPTPQKICLVVNGLSPQSTKLCQYLLGRGAQIHLVSLVDRPLNLPGVTNYWINQEIKVAWEPLRVITGAFNKFRALLELRRIIHRIKPDIVHGHGLNFAGILAVYSGFHPVVVTTRGSDVMQIDQLMGAEQYLIRQTLKKADLVTGSSQALRCQSLKLGMPSSKFQLVYFGVDGEIFKKISTKSEVRRKYGIRAKEKVIFSCRAMKPIYNQDILIEACSSLKLNFKLILLRLHIESGYFQKIQKLIKDRNLQDKVIILDATDTKGMAALYNLADVVVSLAQSDGLAVSFLEAMACEAKIVISNVGFVREWSCDYAQDKHRDNNFWVVPIGDIASTSKAIKDALAMPSERFAPIGQQNRQLILDRAELNQGFEVMEEAYRKVAR